MTFQAIEIGFFFYANSIRHMAILSQGLEAAKPILNLIERKPKNDITSKEGAILEGNIETVQLKNISFHYPKSKDYVLKNVSFEVEKGKTVAIVGPSGSGKSTIAKLLERFYDPSMGELLVNEKPITELNLREYRRKIGYVGQEPCLFNESIKDNLLNSNPDATDQDIEEALRKANAWGFVSGLDKGIKTDVGSLGGKLSGGQKQRIAIARALVRNPSLLIFDEVTSALDDKSEKKVQEAIDNIKGPGITKVVIAHRLTTIENADLIIVLKDGEIVERGTSQELIDQDGVYAKLIKTQKSALITMEEKANKNKIEVIPEPIEENKTYHYESGDDEEALRRPLIEEEKVGEDKEEENEIEKAIKAMSFWFIMRKIYGYIDPKFYVAAIIIGSTIVGACLSS